MIRPGSRWAALLALLALASVTVLAWCSTGSGDTVEGCTEALVAAWDRGDVRVTYPECDGLSAAEVDEATDRMVDELGLDEPIE